MMYGFSKPLLQPLDKGNLLSVTKIRMLFLLSVSLLVVFSTPSALASVHAADGDLVSIVSATRNCSMHHSQASCSDAGCDWCSPPEQAAGGWCYNSTIEQCCNDGCAVGYNCGASICPLNTKCCPSVAGAPTCCAVGMSCCEGVCYDGTTGTCCPVANPWDSPGSPAICGLDQSCCVGYDSLCCAADTYCCTDYHGNVDCCTCNKCNFGNCDCYDP
jgi:hypothetical protein